MDNVIILVTTITAPAEFARLFVTVDIRSSLSCINNNIS